MDQGALHVSAGPFGSWGSRLGLIPVGRPIRIMGGDSQLPLLKAATLGLELELEPMARVRASVSAMAWLGEVEVGLHCRRRCLVVGAMLG